MKKNTHQIIAIKLVLLFLLMLGCASTDKKADKEINIVCHCKSMEV